MRTLSLLALKIWSSYVCWLGSLSFRAPAFVDAHEITVFLTWISTLSRSSAESNKKMRLRRGFLLQSIGSPWFEYGLTMLRPSLTQSKITLLWMCCASLIKSAISSSKTASALNYPDLDMYCFRIYSMVSIISYKNKLKFLRHAYIFFCFFKSQIQLYIQNVSKRVRRIKKIHRILLIGHTCSTYTEIWFLKLT